MKKLRFVKILIAVFVLCGTASTVFSESKVNILQKVRLQLKWLHQFEFAGYYMAIEKGYYQQAGIEVELIEPQENISPVEVVTNGKAEFGISASDIILNRADNKKVVVLASIFQQSPNILLTSKSSGITQGKDLAGKKLALEADSAEIVAFLRNSGVTLAKNQVIPLNYEAKQLLNSEVDAISSYLTDEPYYLDSIGFQYNTISPRSGGIDFYGDILFTTEQLIASNPELVHSFREASILGWKYALNHPYETIDLIYNKYSKRHTINSLKFEMTQTRGLIMPDIVEIGYSNPDRWKAILQTYQQLKLVPGNLSIKGLLYSDYHKDNTGTNWRLAGMFSIIILVITFIAWFFYRSSEKLKAEMNRRKKAETSLQNLNSTLEQRISERNAELKQINNNLTREIDERIKFEKLLEQLKDNYETFFNSTYEPIFVYDLNGYILHCNTAACQRLGYDERELIGESAIFIHPPARKDETNVVIKNIIAGKINVCTIPLMTKSGEQFSVESKVSHGTWNGQPVFFSIYKDLSQLELSEKKFASAFQSSTAMMAISKIDDGKFVDINQEFIEALEYSREELIHKTNSDLKLFIDPKLRDTILEQLDKGIAVRKMEVKFRPKISGIKTGLLSADIIYVGKDRCLLTVTMDITDRKKAEEQTMLAREEAEKANAAKSEFLSRMSHELRTPMNAILGFAQLLEMGQLSAAQRKGVNHILRGGKHLLDLINEVLDITRIESGKLSLSTEPVRLIDVLQEMIETVSPLATKRQVSINFIESPDNYSFVKADRQRLKQILLNLINNAIKYNRVHGYVNISTQIIYNLQEPVAARIFIADNGHGIHKDNIQKLFSPFERIGAEQTETEGSGLGLAVAKKLIDAMNGKIGVDSEFEIGSTFWIELPYSESHIKSLENSGLLTKTDTKSVEKTGTIFYIEDNLSNIELIEQIIMAQRPNIKLVSSRSGNQALELSIKHKPNIILLDLNLPDQHGSEIMNLLIEQDETKNIPIVILSADAMPQQSDKLLSSGAKKYLTKPLDIFEFLKVVDTYISTTIIS
jgi:PAS domain S-box-containing protein